MPLVSTRTLLDRAVADRAGLFAFNVISLEHAEAIAAGAESAGLPAVLQISQNAVRFHGGSLAPVARAAATVAEHSTADLSLHLDHVEDLPLLHQAAECGFSSAMYDAGALPYFDNLRSTRAATEWAHQQGLLLEAELGYIGGKPEQAQSAHEVGVRTDPTEAAEFVARTGVDALAVAVGSSHAMTRRDADLDLELIRRLAETVPVPLVLHGSSGVPDAMITAAVAAGIRKINVGTALNVAFTEAVRATLAEQTSSDPRRYLRPAREATAEVVSRFLRLGSPARDR